MTQNYGATQDEWDHFSLMLGLTGDLLPVVSNPQAVISPESKMKGLGKTPSKYNRQHQVAGISQWTQFTSTLNNVTQYALEPDYGLCIQTRSVRALDCDIDNTILAADIHVEIDRFLNVELPTRRRINADKFLLAFTMPGEYAKRTIKTDYGIIEFLATGQQFVACGTHPSGAKYQWVGGLPEEIPELTPEQFEKLWKRLEECFATEPSTTQRTSSKAVKLSEAAKNDPTAQYLSDKNLVVSTERDGRLHIICPFESEHTSDSAESATSYFPAFTGGFERGHFHCLHAHCAQRSDREFLTALGIDSVADDFENLEESDQEKDTTSSTDARYTFEPWEQAISHPAPHYIVKGVLPEAALAVIYGESTSGKTFFALDMACAIARGEPWRGLKVKQGAVAYIAAEDASGVRQRVKAYTRHHEVQPGTMPLTILADAPNFMKGDDVRDVLKALRAYGKVSVIIADTWSQITSGSNENSGEDVGKALAYCRGLHRATGAIVILIHHSGKDASKGARGHSSMRAAADCEIEITRCEQDRVAQIKKLKNGMDGTEFGFRLHTVLVGEDEDGEDITSCVLEHTTATPKAERGKREPKGVNEKIALRVLGDLAVGGDVGMDDLLSAMVDHMPFDATGGKRDQRRANALRAVQALIERSLLTCNANIIGYAGEA